MSEIRDQLQRDLSRKLQDDLADVLRRQLNLAGVVLETEQLGVLLIEAAVMMARTCAATVASVAEGPAAEQLLDATIAAIFEGVTARRADSLVRIQAVQQRRSAR